MLIDEDILFQRACVYAEANSKSVLRQSRLGYGTDGTVWKTAEHSVVKSFHRSAAYATELACYLRLQSNRVTSIDGLNVPVLEGYSDSLWVIEMTFVQPPYLLDFGKAYVDSLPDYLTDKRAMAHQQAVGKNDFGERWSRVMLILHLLQEKYGIYYADPRRGNINFGEVETDSDDWLSEPEIDYSEYDDGESSD